MTQPTPPIDRLLDLLADRAVGSLDMASRAELDALLAQHPEIDDDSVDLAAAAAATAALDTVEAMPPELRARVLSAMEAPEPVLRVVPAPRHRSSFAAWAGWFAAAACLTLALIFASRLGPRGSSPADAREAFLHSAPDVRTASWGDWDNPERPGVHGEVAWSEAEQKGYMTFDGLRPNDPTKEQYQLWIIDERGLEQRISGAIFNCDDPKHVVVEIDPAVRIHSAAAFAITIERPGGVWVSDMTRRVVIASLQN